MSDAGVMTAAELCRQAVQMRESAQYADAERALLRALEIEHDFAAAHFELGLTYRDQGKIEDAVDYFQLAVHFTPDFPAASFELGEALVKLERADAAKTAYREALVRNPRHGAAWFSLGNLLKADGELEEAVACYQSAVACDPASAQVHGRLGYAYYRIGRYAEAQRCFDAALALEPELLEVHHNLGLLLLETGQAAAALRSFERALAVSPQVVETRTCIAHALRDLGRLDEALAHYDAVLAQHPQFTDAAINRSYALLMKEDYTAGWDAYAHRFTSGAMVARGFPYPEWQGQPLAGKRILVYAEQGLGDEIMFASCLPQLLQSAVQCVIECNTRLAPLFRRSFPQAHVHGADKSDDKHWIEKLPPVDLQVAIGSLPRYLRRSPADFPARGGYLQADAQRRDYWRKEIAAGPALRVGIAWRGGTPRSRQFMRSTVLPQWLPVLRCEKAVFCALQYGDIAPELEDMRVQAGIAITSLGNAVNDLDELAAIISALDLVISIDNTVAHLAGALGQTVWALLPESPEWRYPRAGAAMPWYPSMRLFHRASGETWEPVIVRVAAELKVVAARPRT